MSDFDIASWCERALDELNSSFATLSFPLPRCESEFRTAVNGARFSSVLWDLDQEMRSTCKHEAAPMQAEKTAEENEIIYTTTDYWRDRLWSLLGEQNVSLWDE